MPLQTPPVKSATVVLVIVQSPLIFMIVSVGLIFVQQVLCNSPAEYIEPSLCNIGVGVHDVVSQFRIFGNSLHNPLLYHRLSFWREGVKFEHVKHSLPERYSAVVCPWHCSVSLVWAIVGKVITASVGARHTPARRPFSRGVCRVRPLCGYVVNPPLRGARFALGHCLWHCSAPLSRPDSKPAIIRRNAGTCR